MVPHTLSTLKRVMIEGLSLLNLSRTMIRRYVRLTFAYIVGYEQNLNMLETEKWLRKHRQHRSYNKTIDARHEELYFPEKTDRVANTNPTTSETVEEEELWVADDTEICVVTLKQTVLRAP